MLGIEPSLHAPEACVLPVYDTPTFSGQKIYKPQFNFQPPSEHLSAFSGYYRYTTPQILFDPVTFFDLTDFRLLDGNRFLFRLVSQGFKLCITHSTQLLESSFKV